MLSFSSNCSLSCMQRTIQCCLMHYTPHQTPSQKPYPFLFSKFLKFSPYISNLSQVVYFKSHKIVSLGCSHHETANFGVQYVVTAGPLSLYAQEIYVYPPLSCSPVPPLHIISPNFPLRPFATLTKLPSSDLCNSSQNPNPVPENTSPVPLSTLSYQYPKSNSARKP